MNRRKLYLHFSILVSTLSALFFIMQNCGGMTAADLASLDNLAANSTRMNQCSGNPRNDQTEAMPMLAKILVVGPQAELLDEPLITQTRLALTSIAPEYQKLFSDMGGHVLLTDAAGEICSAESISDDVKGCVFYSPKSPDHQQVIKMVIDPDPAAISHAVTYLFGSFMAQVLPQLFPDAPRHLEPLKERIAVAYLEDVRNSSLFRFEEAHPDFSSADLALLRSRTEVKDLLNELSFGAAQELEQKQRRQHLISKVFMHAFDSFYCNNWASYESFDWEGQTRDQQLAQLQKSKNTRRLMEDLFPKTYLVFESSADSLVRVAQSLTKGSLGTLSLQGSDVATGFSLSARSRGVRTAEYHSPWNAFWGSISKNTGYSSYVESVNRNAAQSRSASVFKNIASNVSSGVDEGTGYKDYRDAVYEGGAQASSGGQAFAQGLKNGYKEKIYDKQYAQTTRDYETASKYGSQNPAFDAVAISMGRHVGTTPIIEGTYGWDLGGDRELRGTERFSRTVEGVTKLSANGAMVAGILPSTRAIALRNPLARNTLYSGVADAQTQAAVGSVMEQKYVDRTVRAFGPGAEVQTVGPQGKVVYRAYGGQSKKIGRWVTNQPVANPTRKLALPANSPASSVAELRLKPGTRYIEGPVANQVEAFGSHATGGGKQMMIIGSEADVAGALKASAHSTAKGVVGGSVKKVGSANQR